MAKKVQGGTAQQSDATLNVTFTVGKFNLDHVEYVSNEVEAAAKAQEPWALEVITKLVEMQAGVITVTEA